ncbi:hypothetical protein GQ55_2G474800 [Panicum hallii var. hallii]|uniref:Secreted protein n=1 Tax=Panicum hallii var. hallii TaxID=1504633 RepID=A0A2T7F043_9POAL|nr:hypothetical protein GQ55_2G474800 [Panicum hallii var. hallii]
MSQCVKGTWPPLFDLRWLQLLLLLFRSSSPIRIVTASLPSSIPADKLTRSRQAGKLQLHGRARAPGSAGVDRRGRLAEVGMCPCMVGARHELGYRGDSGEVCGI